MNKLTKLKRILSSTLAGLLLITSLPLTSFAYTPPNSAGNGDGGTGSGGGTTSYSTAQSYIMSWQGYRFTWTDSSGQKVGNSVDFLNDMSMYNRSDSLNFYRSQCLSDMAANDMGTRNEAISFNQVAGQLNSMVPNPDDGNANTIPVWHTSERESTDAIYNWLQTEQASKNLSGLGDFVTAIEHKTTLSGDSLTKTKAWLAAMFGNPPTKSALLDGINKLGISGYANGFYSTPGQQQAFNDSMFKVVFSALPSDDAYVNSLRIAWNDYTNDPINSGAVDSGYSDYEKAGIKKEDVGNMASNQIITTTKAVAKSVELTNEANTLKEVADTTNKNTSSTSSSSDYNGPKGAAKAISEMIGANGYSIATYGRVPLFIRLGANSWDDTDVFGIKASELLEKYEANEVTLIVEPILSAKPKHGGTGANYSYFVYGTPYNWIQFFNTAFPRDYSGFGSNSGLGNRRMINGAFFLALYLEDNEPTSTDAEGNDIGRKGLFDSKPLLDGEYAAETISDFTGVSRRKMEACFSEGIGVGLNIFAAKQPENEPFGGGSEEGDYRVIKYYRTSLFGADYVDRPEYTNSHKQASSWVTIPSEDGWTYCGYEIVSNDYAEYKKTWNEMEADTTKGTVIHSDNTGEALNKAVDVDPGKTICILYQSSDPIPDTGKNICTYDTKNNPQNPAGSLSYSDGSPLKDDPTVYPTNANTINIIKVYRPKDGTTQYIYKTVKAPHTIIIDNELKQTGYALKEWYCSSNDTSINESRPSDYNWESYKSSNHNIADEASKGNAPYGYTLTSAEYTNQSYEKNLIIPAERADIKTLWLLYEYEITYTEHFLNEDDEEIDTKGPYPVPDDKYPPNPYAVDQYANYEYIKTTDNTGVNTTDTSFVISQGVTHLDIYYKVAPTHLTLYSNEISYGKYDLRNLVKSAKLYDIYDKATSLDTNHDTYPHDSHSGHDLGDDCAGDDDDGYYCDEQHECDYSGASFTDNVFGLSVKSSYTDYEDFIRKFELTEKTKNIWHAQLRGESISGKSDPVKPNAKYILYRASNTDKGIHIYPRLDNAYPDLDTFGIKKESISYEPSQRALHDMGTNYADGIFKKTLKIDIVYETHDTTLRWGSHSCFYGGHSHPAGSYESESVQTPEMANEYYNTKNNTWEYYYTGRANDPEKQQPPKDNDDAVGSINNDKFQEYALTGEDYSQYTFNISDPATYTFYPYVKMYYTTDM